MKNNNNKANGTRRLQIFCYYDGLLKHAWAWSQGVETAGAKGVVSAAKEVASAASVGVTTSAKAEAKAKGVASARFEVEQELAVAE